MTISELNEKLYNSDYIVENPNQIIDIILELFEKNDNSLINQDDLNMYIHEEQKFFQTKNIERIIKIFEKLFIKNKGKIDFIHFKKYLSFIKQNYYISEKISSNIFNYVSNYNDVEMMEILLEFKDELCYDNLAHVLNSLYKQNRLNSKLLKNILDISSIVDVYSFNYLIPYFSDELIEIISDYDINIINYLAPERLTDKLLEKAKADDKYELTDRSPDVLFEDKEFIRKIVSNHPYNIKEVKKISDNHDLLQLAIQNGLKLYYNDFKNYNVFDSSILINELENYYRLFEENSFGNIIVRQRLILDNDTDTERINHIYELLAYAVNNNVELDIIIDYLYDKDFGSLLTEFCNNNLNIDFLLSNSYIMTKLINSVGNNNVNNILFEPNEEFIKKYFECGYYVSQFSSDFIKNSKLLFSYSINYNSYQISSVLQNCNSNFVSKDFIDQSINKGVNILENSLYEITDEYLKNSVNDMISNLEENEYKNFIHRIIQKAGYSVYYIEHNNLLSEKVYNIFGEEMITKLVRNLSFCGEKLNFINLINSNKLDLFYLFYKMESEKNDALEFKYLLDFFNENSDLVENLISAGMTEEEMIGFREYIFHKDKVFTIHDKKYLSNMNETIYNVNEQMLLQEPENTILLKSIVFSTLFNFGYYEIENILGIVGKNRLDNLKKSINNDDYVKYIELIKPYIYFIESVYSCSNNETLKEIASNINKFFINYPSEVKEIKKLFDKMEVYMKMLYIEELNNNLSKTSNQSYIEYNEDSYFLAHVMNAFGSGSKLSDFKNPRFIGKTYICLSAIGRGVNPYCREEIDMNHVTLLFNYIPPNSLISMSSHDMASQGGNGQMDVKVNNNFNTLFKILDYTKYGPNEYVIYRENEAGKSLYPCGVLVVGDIPSVQETEAANYLGVPLIKRKHINKIKNSRSDNYNEILIDLDNSNNSNNFYDYVIEKLNQCNVDFVVDSNIHKL